MNHQKVMTSYLLAFIEGLKTAGIKKVVISPGSRSTPLSLLLHRDQDITCFIDVDERSAAFFALGLIKATDEPVAIVCTSGTAAANYYPAICEAEATNLPLVVLTTDRPPELRQVGAPQAMDQQQLYASHVKRFVEMTVPEASDELLRYSHWQGLTNSLHAQQAPKGPVHVNFPLREPLLPDLAMKAPKYTSSTIVPSQRNVDISLLRPLLGKKGLIIVGEQHDIKEAQHYLALAEWLNWPIVGDPLTNLATSQSSTQYLKQSDLIFSETTLQPEVILRFGRLPVTKNVLLYLKRVHAPTILVESAFSWQDQLQTTNYFIEATITEFLRSIQQATFTKVADSWITAWQQEQELATKVLAAQPLLKEFNESAATVALVNQLHDSQLFVANSNAIRFVDRLTATNPNRVTIHGNRGVNGIDGLLSTTAGIAANQAQPTFLLIGDLALFHDMNGLQMMKQYQLPITIVLLNNNGGGIFSFLSQQTLAPEDFNPLFGTPLDMDFQHVAKLYGAQYHQPTSLKEFEALIIAAQQQPRFQLIEVRGTQKEPVDLWETICQDYQLALGDTHG